MKILHLSDLHLNRDWLAWATLQAKSYDLVCASGDLLDIFSRRGHFWGALRIKRWAEAFPAKLALCSGNHDASSPDMVPDAGLLPLLQIEERLEAEKLMMLERWMDTLERPGIVTDNRTELVETPSGRVVVTTVPYSFIDGHLQRELWKAGAQLRRETGAPWAVLHHEPPRSPLVGGPFGSYGLVGMIETYRPDFVFSGHIHLQPYRGDFAERLGKTWCFNPGCFDEADATVADIPNHIVLDLAKGTATWHFIAANKPGLQSKAVNIGR